MTDNVVHMTTKAALKEIMRLCIEHGDEDDFVARMEEEGGFEVFTRFALWRSMDRLTAEAANGELFPPGTVDAAAFQRMYDIEGHSRARSWLAKRFKSTALAPVSGRRADGNTTRVVYLAVGSKLEAAHRKPPKSKSRETVRLTEDE